MYAMTIIVDSDIIFLDAAHDAGTVLTKASELINDKFQAGTTCNTVERWIASTPGFRYKLRKL